MGRGFLGTAASRAADIVLLIEIGMGMALIFGAVLARRRRFRAHAWCQSAVVLLNAPVLLLYMVPQFRRFVVPSIPAGIGEAYNLVAIAHGVLGSAAELLSLYVLLVAATPLIPPRLRFTGYRRWMRGALFLWLAALLLGLLTYARWYIAPLYGG